MELAVWGAEVAAVHAPPRERAARSTAPWARKPPEPSKAEREQAKRAEARAERLHLAGLTNAAVIIMGVVVGAMVVLLVVLVASHR